MNDANPNPYASPKTDESARRTPRQQPVGWLRQVVMGVLCAVAAPAMFMSSILLAAQILGRQIPPINYETIAVFTITYGVAAFLVVLSTSVLRRFYLLKPTVVVAAGVIIAAGIVGSMLYASGETVETLRADPESALMIPLITFAFSGPWLAFGLWLRLIERRRAAA